MGDGGAVGRGSLTLRTGASSPLCLRISGEWWAWLKEMVFHARTGAVVPPSGDRTVQAEAPETETEEQ